MSRIKELSRFQVIGIILLVIVAVNFIKGIVVVFTARDWNSLYAKLVTLAVLAAIGFIYRDSLKKGWEAMKKRREVARQEFEKSRGGHWHQRGSDFFSHLEPGDLPQYSVGPEAAGQKLLYPYRHRYGSCDGAIGQLQRNDHTGIGRIDIGRC